MVKALYHGSEFVIKSPQFGVGRIDNDYGRGFYCTEKIDLAKEAVASLLKNREFDLEYGIAAEVKKYILENFRVDYSAADVMTGFRADDSTGRDGRCYGRGPLRARDSKQ